MTIPRCKCSGSSDEPCHKYNSACSWYMERPPPIPQSGVIGGSCTTFWATQSSTGNGLMPAHCRLNSVNEACPSLLCRRNHPRSIVKAFLMLLQHIPPISSFVQPPYGNGTTLVGTCWWVSTRFVSSYNSILSFYHVHVLLFSACFIF